MLAVKQDYKVAHHLPQLWECHLRRGLVVQVFYILVHLVSQFGEGPVALLRPVLGLSLRPLLRVTLSIVALGAFLHRLCPIFILLVVRRECLVPGNCHVFKFHQW